MENSIEKVVLETEAIKLVGKYGIPYPNHKLAQSADEAGKLASSMVYPVVLKIVSPDISHKSDAGGVMLNLNDKKEVEQGYRDLTDSISVNFPTAEIRGVLVCEQADEGLELIVGALHDAVFGPTIMFGLGGIFTEVFEDISFRIAPIKRIDAEEMVQEIKGTKILEGIRGQAPKDKDALIELLMSVSRMITEEKGLKELDLNPVRLYEKGLLALDARIVQGEEI